MNDSVNCDCETGCDIRISCVIRRVCCLVPCIVYCPPNVKCLLMCVVLARFFLEKFSMMSVDITAEKRRIALKLTLKLTN
jgi:hypothetical protein